MSLENHQKALLDSYERHGGINHLDGANLPSQDKVVTLTRDLMHLLFPGYFENSGLRKQDVPAWIERLLGRVHAALGTEVEKCFRFAGNADPAADAAHAVSELLGWLPEIRRIVQTDVSAAYSGDPAARSVEEIILAYPCTLAISVQRIARILYTLGVPLLPRMMTEYAHERTGIDIHPGAQIGPHFFIDHGSGVVIGETTRIGAHVKIYQGVTLGAKSFETDSRGVPIKGIKRHPDIEDHVTIYAHATILGGETRIGAHSVIGANVWLMDSIAANSIAYYQDSNLTIRPRRGKETVVESVDWAI